MTQRKSPIASGDEALDRKAEKELRAREVEGLEPEQRPGPRQNEGISSAGRLYTSAEEAERASPSEDEDRPGRVDRDAVHVLGDHPKGKHPERS